MTLNGSGQTFGYDAENRQVSFNGNSGQYFYDGDGHRVKKIDSTGTTVFVYNAGGQLVAEYHSDPAPPAAGGGGTSYLTSDHLGSTRVVTKADGTVKARYDYLPFGEELGSGIGGRTVGMGYSAADSTKQKFTQKERDNESGLDYFLARYYSSAQGRFTSPDEFSGGPDELYDFASTTADNPTFYADLRQPQSLNKYQYCYNNPFSYIDPDGHQNGYGGVRLKSPIARAYAKGGECINNVAIGVGKSVANLFIGIVNLTAGEVKVAPYEEKGDCQGVAMHATDVGLIVLPLLGGEGPVGVLTAEAEETTVVAAETANAKAATAEVKPGSPALKGDPYSPAEVSKRQSQTRRDLGTGNNDPNSPIPEQGPGRNIKGQHKADTTQQHRTGERNVNPSEEHSRKAKGTGDKPRNQ